MDPFLSLAHGSNFYEKMVGKLGKTDFLPFMLERTCYIFPCLWHFINNTRDNKEFIHFYVMPFKIIIHPLYFMNRSIIGRLSSNLKLLKLLMRNFLLQASSTMYLVLSKDHIS